MDGMRSTVHPELDIPRLSQHIRNLTDHITFEHRDDAGSCNWVGLILREAGHVSSEAVNGAGCS